MKKQLSFSRNQRIVTKAEFKLLFDKSKKIIQKNLVLLYRPNEKPQARLGIVVGKRTAKSAVLRNRIKRIIRESFRRNQNQVKKVDMIVIARKPCEKMNKETLRKGLDQLWEKLML